MFTTDAGTSVLTVKQAVTGMNATIDNAKPVAGGTAQITIKLVGTLTPEADGIEVAPNAATYDVTVSRASGSTTTPVNSPSTRVDEYGVLHVSKNLKTGDVITIACKSTYINPSGATTTYTKNVTATVA